MICCKTVLMAYTGSPPSSGFLNLAIQIYGLILTYSYAVLFYNFIVIALNYRCFTGLYLLGKIVEDSYIIFFFLINIPLRIPFVFVCRIRNAFQLFRSILLKFKYLYIFYISIIVFLFTYLVVFLCFTYTFLTVQ